MLEFFGSTRVRPTATRVVARTLAALALCVLLASCATVSESPSSSTSSSDDAAQAERLYRQGDFDQAANEFLDLARSAGGDDGAHFRLRAAESLRERGDLEGAARALGDLKRRRLQGDEPIRLDLLDAEIALKKGDAAQALSLLAISDSRVPDALRVRALELRARRACGG